LSFNITDDVELTANFEIKTYTITASVEGGNGIITPDGATTINHGENQTYTITPNDDYHIAQVLIDGENDPAAVANGTYTFTDVTANHTIVAIFAPDEIFYNVTVLAVGEGDVEIVGYPGTTANVAKGTTVTVRATADTEWTFQKWTDEEGDVTTNAEYSFAVIRDIVLTAHFALGIKDNILSSVVLFPNPFKDEITVSHPELVKNVQITNLLGQKVREVIFDGKLIITTTLDAGIYFIEIESFTGERLVYNMVKK